MSRKLVVIKNSSIGLLSQLVTVVFAFVTRSLFVQYIGMELLGINSTFTSVLNALSLSELGFEAAVVYSLYRPMYENDQEKINDIINILKVIYRGIGGIFVVGSIVLLPFLKYILVGVDLPQRTIYLYFLLQSSASICTYFLAYKRTLLYANQKGYITKMVDMVVSCLLNVLQCVSIIVFRNYAIYLILKLTQVLISNLIIHLYCARCYPYLHKGKVNREIFSEIIKNVKNIFLGKIAGFIYASTDSIVISAFINTVTVAYYGNYTIVVSNLKTLINGLLTPITPIVGNYLVEENNESDKENIFLLYTHVRFLIALVIIVPSVVLLEQFITIWLGKEYILPSVILYLLAAEFYIDLVHTASVDYINGMGLFDLDKYVELLGAVSNIVFSLLFVKVIGLAGVIVGTVISQCLFWIGRVSLVYFKGIGLKPQHFWLYWLRNLYYVMVFLVCVLAGSWLYAKVRIANPIFSFVTGGILCELCVLVLGTAALFWMKEHRFLTDMLMGMLKKCRRRR